MKTLSTLSFIDEVGRGPLAGPVVACCISLHLNGSTLNSNNVSNQKKQILKKFDLFLANLGVNDSKKLFPLKRQDILKSLSIRPLDCFQLNGGQIIEFENLRMQVTIAQREAPYIEKHNILEATFDAMNESFQRSYFSDELDNRIVFVDGNKTPQNNEIFIPIIKGDQLLSPIALASIVAKEYRDLLMKKWDEIYPHFNFFKHSGYGTKYHLEKIKTHGPSPIHRRTFRGVKEYFGENSEKRNIK